MRKLYTCLLSVFFVSALYASSTKPLELTTCTPEQGIDLNMERTMQTMETYSDDDYTEWSSLGIAEVSQDALGTILWTFNSYLDPEQEEIQFTYTTEVMERTLKSNPEIRQFKFTKFLGYNDMIASFNYNLQAYQIGFTPTGMPIPGYFEQNYGCTSIDFRSLFITYSDARRIFNFSNNFFLIFGNSGFPCSSFTVTLPDAHPEIGLYVDDIISGGISSTDNYVTYSVVRTGVDHIRYVVFRDSSTSPVTLIPDIIFGEVDYKEATDEITITYDQGYGGYYVMALAYDADDKYMNIYLVWGVISNLAPEGTWKSIGKGTWYHPYARNFQIPNNNTGTYEDCSLPTDKLQWEVEIEKRIDTDRQVYRVVNPYGPDCALNESFTELIKAYYGDEWNDDNLPYRTDDTFWFIFDATDPENVTIESERPNGAMEQPFMPTHFAAADSNGPATLKDLCFIFPQFGHDPMLGYIDLRIDLPGYRGIGFEYTYRTNNFAAGIVGPSVEAVRYILIPADGEMPSRSDLTAEATRVANGTSSYEIHEVKRADFVQDEDENNTEYAVLPFDEYVSEPSWMLIVPVDAQNIAFDYSIAPIQYSTTITGVSLDECLLTSVRAASTIGTFENLTMIKTIRPDEPNLEYYSLPSPYTTGEVWWMPQLPGYETKSVAIWEFVYNTESGVCRFTTPSHFTGYDICHTGIYPHGLLEDYGQFIFILFKDGSKIGNDFIFPLYGIGFDEDPYAAWSVDSSTNQYVFHLPDAGVENIIVGDTSADAPVEYYNLQGVKVTNPSNGIYIVRQGNKVSKQLIR